MKKERRQHGGGGVRNDGDFQTNSGVSRELNNGGKRGMKR